MTRLKIDMIRLIFVILLLNACSSKIFINTNNIANIYMYDYIHKRGFTTVGAYNHFLEMERLNTNKLIFSEEDKKKFIEILNSAKVKRHFQTKLEQCCIFLSLNLVNNENINVVIRQNSLITNISNFNDYKIENNSHVQWLTDFCNKQKCGNIPD